MQLEFGCECDCFCCCCFLFIWHSNAIISSILHIRRTHCVWFLCLFRSLFSIRVFFVIFSVVENCHFTTYWLWFFLFRFVCLSIFPICLCLFLRLAVKQLIGCVYNAHFCVPHAHRRSNCVSVSCSNWLRPPTANGATILHRKNTTQLSSYFKSNFYRVFCSILFLYFFTFVTIVCSILLTYLFDLLNFSYFFFIPKKCVDFLTKVN